MTWGPRSWAGGLDGSGLFSNSTSCAEPALFRVPSSNVAPLDRSSVAGLVSSASADVTMCAISPYRYLVGSRSVACVDVT